MTHSHDTSTPAMSAETVPSEEAAKLVYEAMVWARDQQPGVPVPKWIDGGNSDAQYEARRVIRKIADLSASHLAKEGREAGAVEPIEKHRIANRLRGMFDMSMSSADDFNRLTPAGFRLLRQAHDALIAPDEAVAAPAPNPSPSAKGGDAVREALEKIIATDRTGPMLYERRWDGIEQAIGNADGECAAIARAALAALSTPTEGPASQTEGMGGEAAADGSQAPLSDGRHRHLSRITEIVRGADSRMEAEQIALGYLRGAMSNEERAERAARDWAVAKWHEEVANRPLQNTHRRSLDTTWRQVIRYFGGDDERICGPRHDDLVATHDGMDFATPGTQVKPLEWQRFDNARTVTYRAMCPLGGIYYITSANEDPSFDGWKSHLGEFASLEAAKAAQQAEHEAKVRGCLARAALTPPETAEAVPPLYLIRKGGAFYRPNSQGYTRSIAEAGRYSLAEAEAITHPNGSNGPRDGMDYIPAPALASDPAPATDDRERLVEALREAAVPFVRHYADWMNRWPDDQEVSVFPRHTYGEIRALRAALATEASQ